EADDRRHRLDLVPPGEFERAIVDDRDARRERGIVLAHDLEPTLAHEPLEHRRDEHAGRAIPLHERDESFHWGGTLLTSVSFLDAMRRSAVSPAENVFPVLLRDFADFRAQVRRS